jgi:hypothetical protein
MDIQKLGPKNYNFKKFKVGPHSQYILSLIYGTLLGDASIEKRSNNIRITFQQENKNVEYLM